MALSEAVLRQSQLHNQSKTRARLFCYTNKVMDATRLSDDRSPLPALLAALKPMSDRHGYMPLAWIKTLLIVALDEGKGVAHYSREANVHRTIMSRALHCLGDKNRRGDNPGLGLVEIKVDPVGGNRRQVFLTGEGYVAVAAIIASLRRQEI